MKKRYVVTAIRPLSLSGQRVEVAECDDHSDARQFLTDHGSTLRSPMLRILEKDERRPTWSAWMS